MLAEVRWPAHAGRPALPGIAARLRLAYQRPAGLDRRLATWTPSPARSPCRQSFPILYLHFLSLPSSLSLLLPFPMSCVTACADRPHGGLMELGAQALDTVFMGLLFFGVR